MKIITFWDPCFRMVRTMKVNAVHERVLDPSFIGLDGLIIRPSELVIYWEGPDGQNGTISKSDVIMISETEDPYDLQA